MGRRAFILGSIEADAVYTHTIDVPVSLEPDDWLRTKARVVKGTGVLRGFTAQVSLSVPVNLYVVRWSKF